MATVVGTTALRRESPAEIGGKTRSRLRLVVARRAARFHPAHRLAFLAASIVVVTCLIVVSAQAIVAARQIRIDYLRQELAASVAKNENLQVQRAALTSPSRILQIAEHQLGMTTPSNETYLVPISPYVSKPAKK